jgi:hypothetical protein
MPPAGAPSFRTLESESFEPAVTRSYPEVRYACPTVTARVNLLLTAEARRREDEFRRMYAETTSPTRPYWRQSIQCEMSAIGPRLASVSCIEWQDCGGAHPIWYTFGATVRVEGSDVRVVRLEDLFRPGSRPALVRRARDAVNALKASRGSGPVDDETVDRALGSFALGERSLELLFDDYALGPHIAPIVGVDLSYASLADLLLPDGPVSRL